MAGSAWAVRVRAIAIQAACGKMVGMEFGMKFIRGELMNRDDAVNPLHHRSFRSVAAADFQYRRFVAIGTPKGIPEQYRQSHPQAVAAEKAPGTPVGRTFFGGENRRHAQRATGS